MRIVGGAWRGRALKAPAGRDTRPTSDRVREAVFDALGARVGALTGVAVLDVFAGTGALGLEALSRGAERAVFVERGRDALAALRANISTLGSADCTVVVEGDATGFALARALERGPFALLLLDPPYRIEPAETAAVIGRADGALESGALVVWEHATGIDVVEPGGWRRVRTYTYGDTSVTFLERDEGGEDG